MRSVRGRGIADELDKRFPNVRRYSNGRVSREPMTYFDNWAESLDILGNYMPNCRYIDGDLRTELLMAARVVEFSETMVKSRGPTGEDVIEATPKDDIKERLKHSPDYLDAALMAVWGEFDDVGQEERFTW